MLTRNFTGPALAVLELGSVARGMVVTDVMLKRAPITLLQAQPITPGKYLILITGGEEEVKQSLQEGVEYSHGTIIDRLYLAKADAQLLPAIAGAPYTGIVDSLGIVETFSVATCLNAADRAVKAAEVNIVNMRLARGLAGKAFFTITGKLDHIEAALSTADALRHDGLLFATEIIPRPHRDLIHSLES